MKNYKNVLLSKLDESNKRKGNNLGKTLLSIASEEKARKERAKKTRESISAETPQTDYTKRIAGVLDNLSGRKGFWESGK